jgi:hypothetical protein
MAMHLLCHIAIWPKLELKTRPKLLLGYLLLVIALPEIGSESNVQKVVAEEAWVGKVTDSF